MKMFRWLFLLVLLGSSMGCLSQPVFAEAQQITAVGEYTMGDGETMAAAKERARLEAMRAAAEQAGVYLESSSAVRGMELTADVVRTIAGSVLQVQHTDYKKELTADGNLRFTATVTALVDPVDAVALQNQLKEKNAQQAYAALQADYAKLEAEMKELKAQHAAAPTAAARQQIEQAMQRNEKALSAAGWLSEGERYRMQKKYALAQQAYRQALAMDKSRSDAWYGLGRCLEALEQKNAAIEAYQQYLQQANPDSYSYYLLDAKRRLAALQQPAGKGNKLQVFHGADRETIDLKSDG